MRPMKNRIVLFISVVAFIVVVGFVGFQSIIPLINPPISWAISGEIMNEVTHASVAATVYINGTFLAKDIESFRYEAVTPEVRVRVEADNFQIWDVTLKYKKDLPNTELTLPIRLKPLNDMTH